MNKYAYLIMFIAIVAIVGSCSHFNNESRQEADAIESIIETEEAVVRNCEYLGSVTGKIPDDEVFDKLKFFPEIKCKREALIRASRLGATHVVWLHVYKTSATALAYKCSGK